MAEPDPDIEATVPEVAAGDTALHAEALRRFDSVIVAVQEERALALSDRRFASIAGAQWEGDWADQFENSIMVEVNKTAMGVEKIIGDYRANRVTVNFRGVGKDTSEETAETLDGMFRADVYNSKGGQAFDNSFDEAVNGGMGAWRMTNVYEDEYDPENDHQRVAFKAIVDADQSLFWDPNSKLYDKSDATWAILITAYARAAFEAEFGAGKASEWPSGILKTYYDWFTPDVVRVAEYYVLEDKAGLLRIFEHRATGEERREWAADLDAQDLQDMTAEGWREVRTRRGKRKQVAKYVLSGCEVLRPRQVIAGDCIPIVPVYGKRWFIDNMERSRGHVRLAKDPQRIYNAQISKLTETAALAPLERPIFTPEQVFGHSESWAEANLNRAPYALINAITMPDGTPFVGPISKIEPPQLSPVLSALVQVTANDIAELTSSNDGADQAQSNISADAMDIAATRTDAKSAIYMDNMRQSMQRCGEIYLAMARDIYVEAGREVETLSADGKDHGTATLAEGVADEKGGYSIRNDIAKGKYKVISDVTEATTTRRDKTVKTLVSAANIASAIDPNLAGVCLATALINMDGEGMTDLQAYVRAKLVQQGAVKPTDEEKADLEKAQQAQGQQQDPQAEALAAVAAKEGELAKKAVADTALSKAKTVLTLAQAHQANVGTHHNALTARMGIVQSLHGLNQPPEGAR